MEKLIENWLSLHEDNTVEIDGYGYDTIVARNDIDCNGNFIKIEYVSIEHGCPCCEGTTYTYYTFDTIDFTDCQLRFDAADGSTIKDYNVADGMTKYRFGEELSEHDVENFFDKDWKTLGEWQEGDGRGQTQYEILYVFRMTIISIVSYCFDDFHMPKYYLIHKD